MICIFCHKPIHWWNARGPWILVGSASFMSRWQKARWHLKCMKRQEDRKEAA